MRNNKKKKVFFRADGNSAIGLGHIIRSLALAEMLGEYYSCVFMVREPSEELLVYIRRVCAQIIILNGNKSFEEEALEVAQVIRNEAGCMVVLDGYSFNTKYQEALRSYSCKLINIDDIHNCHFISDVIINHSISAKKSEYSAEPYTQFYLGLEYALLRSSFVNYASSRNQGSFQWNNNVFISLGGADPNNDLQLVLSALKASNGNEIINYKVVVGSAYKFYNELLSLSWLEEKNITIYKGISEWEMLELMKSCSTAICSPSSVAIEYMAVGGLLYLQCIADNQLEFYEKAQNLGVGLPFKSYPSDLNEKRAHEMYRKHCSLIDGHQRNRFLSIFNNLSDGVKR